MRIAQISPLYESVPLKLYGGTERIVSYLTEELIELGHDVTLFASGDSVTDARLVSGEIGEEEKNDFLGNALALLFPIDWPEPFGLIMIESLATGTLACEYVSLYERLLSERKKDNGGELRLIRPAA